MSRLPSLASLAGRVRVAWTGADFQPGSTVLRPGHASAEGPSHPVLPHDATLFVQIEQEVWAEGREQIRQRLRMIRRRRPSPTGGRPPDLRARLERARLDTLAWLRALDAAHLAPDDLPQRALHDVFHLDADCAEALWALDQPTGRIDHRAMLRDTLHALERIAPARDQLRAALHPAARDRLQAVEPLIRATLDPGDAYDNVPGRDPNAC